MEQFDIVPELKKKIESAFKDLVNNDRVLSSLSEKIQSGKGTYEDAHNFAGELAKCLQQAFQAHLSADQLPNGRFYYNMASRIIPDSLKTNHRMISEVCVSVQESLNESAGLHIQAQTAPVNQDRISGLVYRVSQDDFDKTKWVLGSPIENFCRSVVDDHAKANADFHYRSGLRPKIIRRTAGKCCKWCSDLAGSYDYYPDMNRDVFRRHDNCRCTVVYDPANGSRRVQDVWSKSWETESLEQENSPKKKNANTPIARSIIYSSKYRKSLDQLNESKEITRSIYRNIKRILNHRTETWYEDLVYIHPESGKVLIRDDFNKERSTFPSKKMREMVTKNPGGIISIHNHPGSSVPSISDVMNARRYKYGLIAAHNGNLIKYKVNSSLPDNERRYIGMLLDNLNYEYENGRAYGDEAKEILDKLTNHGVDIEWINLN